MAFCSNSVSSMTPASRSPSLPSLHPPARSPFSLNFSSPKLGVLTSVAIRGSISIKAMVSDTDPKAGVPLYKPKSYEVLVSDAARSLVYALDDGKTRLEIDFP